jgi:hypothetical protein
MMGHAMKIIAEYAVMFVLLFQLEKIDYYLQKMKKKNRAA